MRSVMLRFGVISAAFVTAAGAVYHSDVLNNPWCSSFRIVRFGRATNAVSSYLNELLCCDMYIHL